MTRRRSVPFRHLLASGIAASLACLLLSGCSSVTAAEASTASPQGHTTMTSQSVHRVSVHDPSVVDDNGTYYIFGSHRAWAKSKDLVHWTGFTNNLSSQYSTLLKDIWEAWPKQSSNPDITGNMWAPDVTWNKTMKKWCMYMSLNGAEYKSTIVLLTADKIDGDWTYVGPVVYSGFNRGNYFSTDVGKVLGEDPNLDRYQSTTDTKINAIDPAIAYDDNGDMWMTFGSWFGGVWMLKLDPATGLRDYSASYQTVPDKSDAYYGVKLAGGHGNSGEGSYLLHTNGYWYLFLSYGELQQRGGYQIRMYRSKNITGPYVDQNGQPAVATSSEAVNWTGDKGVRLLGSYTWSGSSDKHIEVAQGHNSALVDKKGNAFLVYHSRFADTGEVHEVRTRQLLPTADGWLTAAPYEYLGTTMDKSSAAVTDEQASGEYEVVLQDPHTFFKGSKKANAKNTSYRGVTAKKKLILQKNHSITGDFSGRWIIDKHNNITLNISGQKYRGQIGQLPRETDGKNVTAFSVLGANVSYFGSKK